MSISREEFQKRIAKYVPESSAHWVTDHVFNHGVGLTIKKGRQSKLGDYRAPFRHKGHRISINYELNPEEFLLTFIHELAHLLCFEQYKNKVNPHGTEWKRIYSQTLQEAITLGFFPQRLLPHLNKHLNKPGATSCSDPVLRKALNPTENETVLHELETGEVFKIGNMLFEKGPLQRTRYKCLNLLNQRHYLVQKHAPVEKVTAPNT